MAGKEVLCLTYFVFSNVLYFFAGAVLCSYFQNGCFVGTDPQASIQLIIMWAISCIFEHYDGSKQLIAKNGFFHFEIFFQRHKKLG